MKIAIEAIGVRSGGGVEVALNLLRRLISDRGHQVVALLPDSKRYDEVAAKVHRAVRFAANASLTRKHVILQRVVPRICKEEKADVLLCLGNFAPRRAPCPTIVFVQNAWYVYKEPTGWGRLTWREKLVVLYGRRALSARLAPVDVIVQTPLMKRRLASVRGGDDSRITVIPSVPSLPPVMEGERASRRGGAFAFLCLSTYSAHKNFEILIPAVKALRKFTSRAFRCVLTLAPEQHPGARRLLERIRRDGLDDLIVNIGLVRRENLAQVYQQADAHLLPTLLETVGLTYDEAMHFGLPIVTSDRDFARERCGDAAVYFDPLDAESVARAMARVMEDADLRARLAENGRRILAESPTWEEITARFVELLERVARRQSVGQAQPALVG